MSHNGLRVFWGPLYLRLTAVVLGTLSLFGVTVVFLHVAALGRGTAPMRAEVLRIVANMRVGRLPPAAGEGASAPFPSALFDQAGVQRSGDPVPWWIARDRTHLEDGEHCSGLGLCYAVRSVTLPWDGSRGKLIVYQLSGPSALAPVSVAFIASVLLWLLASGGAGLLLLSALRRADASRRRLLAGLAHDLGTPLTSIRGFAETLVVAEGSVTPEAYRRGWSVVYREALRMQRLIEDMLALTRLEAGRLVMVRRAFDLRDAVDAAAERARLAFGRAPALTVPDTEARTVADRDRIDQVLGNLLDNAYRHGRGLQVTVELRSEGGLHRVVVTDGGPGLSSKAMERLFEPFHRGDGEAGGTGLGLAIARSILEQHGGSLAVRNRPEGGCQAVLALPASQEGSGPGVY